MWRFHPSFALDVVGRAGYLRGDEAQQSTQGLLYLALAIGPAWIHSLNDAWRMRLGGRLTHIHYASLESWKRTPWSNLVGDSSGGVEHRSGVEGFVGLTGGEIIRWGR